MPRNPESSVAVGPGSPVEQRGREETRPAPRASVRRWRRRGRRAQVSAVATILGLLLVVTFIATYLTTTLPNQMSVNDLNHDVQVENQVSRLSTVVEMLAARGTIGGETLAPVTLGSAGAPPFAGQDAASIGPLSNSTAFEVNYTLAGPLAYQPPNGGTQGGTVVGSSCTETSSSISCTASATVHWNYTGTLANQSAYAVTLSGGGTAVVNVSSNLAVVTISATSNSVVQLEILGSNDTVSVTVSTVPENILVFGNNDTVTFTGSATGSFQHVTIVGNYDTVGNSATGSGTFVASIYGSHDALNPGTVTGSTTFQVYFNGFNPSAPTAQCPMDNLSSSDTVGAISATGSSNHFTVTYNNTVYSGSGTIPGTGGSWTVNYRIPTPFACPFYSPVLLPVSSASLPGAGLLVSLRNTYTPAAEVAYDEGAVVYAQPGGIPLMENPPSITLTSGLLSVIEPVFIGAIGTDAGTSTAVVALRLVAVHDLDFPTTGFALRSGSNVVITVLTPYASAWVNYLSSTPQFSSTTISCTGANGVCSATYAYVPGGPIGKIVMTVPAQSLALTQAYFVVSLS